MKRLAFTASISLTVCLLAMAVGSFSRQVPAYGLIAQTARRLDRARYLHIGHALRRLPSLSGGVAFSAVEAYRDQGSTDSTGFPTPTQTSLGCANRTSDGDIRVNQDCTLRRQAEEDIAVDPTNPKNLVAGQNDSSAGLNHCGFDYSFDGGVHWGTGIPPFYDRLNSPPTGHTIFGGPGTGHTYDAASDPSVTFDSRGNAYFSCILFDIKDNASALYVARSPAGAGGSFYNDIPAAPSKGTDPGHYVVVEDNSANASPDQEKIAADSNPASPYRDNVYAVWTEFLNDPSCSQGGACSSPIYFSRSTNHALTWSKPLEISGNSSTLCFGGILLDKRRKPHDCDFDEGAELVVLPNGTIRRPL